MSTSYNLQTIDTGQSQSANAGSSSDKTTFAKQRLHSLDAYRGLIMISLSFAGFGIAKTAALQLEQDPGNEFWTQAKFQFSHVQWVGCTFWDMIQPSFMFMVGTSMAYSYVKRKEAGHSYPRMFCHALWRSAVLVFLGIFLISNWGNSTSWSFTNVLTQIGLGYPFLFLLWGRKPLTQTVCAAVILIGTWSLYSFWPETGLSPQNGNQAVGVPADWSATYLTDVDGPWHKNANAGHFIDLQLLNKLPLEKPFEFSGGGYPTINFIPSLATMLFGLMCGELLRSGRSRGKKLLMLILAGLSGLGVGYLLHTAGVCPVIKKIWTPSWAIYSTGWCCLILAGMYLFVDILRLRFFALPLIIVGMNSIAVYCMGMLLKPWTARTLKTHLGSDIFNHYGELYAPTTQAVAVGLCFWLVCLWMYRQKFFVRV